MQAVWPGHIKYLSEIRILHIQREGQRLREDSATTKRAVKVRLGWPNDSVTTERGGGEPGCVHQHQHTQGILSLSLSLSLSTVYRLVSTISTPISVCRKHTNLVVLIIFLIPVLFTRSAVMYCTLYLKPVGRGKCDDSDTCLHMLFKFSMIYRGVVIVRPVIHLIRRLQQHSNDQRITDSLQILSTPASSTSR